MLDRWTRVLKETLLEGTARQFIRIGVTPNQLTLLSLIAGCACAAAASRGATQAALLLWVLNRTLDGLDGVVARISRKTSDFGGLFDIAADFIVYSLAPVAIAWAIWPVDKTMWAVVSLLEGSYFVNAGVLFHLAAILEKRGQGKSSTGELTSVTMPPALIEGTETVVAYSLFFVMAPYPPILVKLFIIFGMGVSISVVQRLWWAYRYL